MLFVSNIQINSHIIILQDSLKNMKYIDPNRVKVLMMMFFGTGVIGLSVGLLVAPPQLTMFVTFLGVVNVSLGAFFVWVYLTQQEKPIDKRKKKRKSR